MLKVLIACEESQRVCGEFRNLGHKAYSCDLLPCGGEHPEWHLQQDCIPLLEQDWDLVIAHPPCTYLTNTGNRWFNIERYGEKAIKRHRLRQEAYEFFMQFVNCKCEHVAIENPVGYMNTHYRKPDQFIQPYEYGDPESKKTCLWLKGLPKLQPTEIVEPRFYVYESNGKKDPMWHYETSGLPAAERAIARSKTFPGIAKAMAAQWSEYLEGLE